MQGAVFWWVNHHGTPKIFAARASLDIKDPLRDSSDVFLCFRCIAVPSFVSPIRLVLWRLRWFWGVDSFTSFIQYITCLIFGHYFDLHLCDHPGISDAARNLSWLRELADYTNRGVCPLAAGPLLLSTASVRFFLRTQGAPGHPPPSASWTGSISFLPFSKPQFFCKDAPPRFSLHSCSCPSQCSQCLKDY